MAICKRKPMGLIAPSARNPLVDNLILFPASLPKQRAGGRGGAESRPCGAPADSAGAAGGRLRPGRCGRVARSTHACGYSGLADVSGLSCDGLFGRAVGGGAQALSVGSADDPRAGAERCRPGCAGWRLRRAAATGGCGQPGAGEPLLAVHHDQHEPGGVRGVSGAVPERRVPSAGGGPARGAGVAGRQCACVDEIRCRRRGFAARRWYPVGGRR